MGPLCAHTKMPATTNAAWLQFTAKNDSSSASACAAKQPSHRTGTARMSARCVWLSSTRWRVWRYSPAPHSVSVNTKRRYTMAFSVLLNARRGVEEKGVEQIPTVRDGVVMMKRNETK